MLRKYTVANRSEYKRLQYTKKKARQDKAKKPSIFNAGISHRRHEVLATSSQNENIRSGSIYGVESLIFSSFITISIAATIFIFFLFASILMKIGSADEWYHYLSLYHIIAYCAIVLAFLGSLRIALVLIDTYSESTIMTLLTRSGLKQIFGDDNKDYRYISSMCNSASKDLNSDVFTQYYQTNDFGVGSIKNGEAQCLFLDPRLIYILTNSEMKAVLFHELSHLADQHVALCNLFTRFSYTLNLLRKVSKRPLRMREYDLSILEIKGSVFWEKLLAVSEYAVSVTSKALATVLYPPTQNIVEFLTNKIREKFHEYEFIADKQAKEYTSVEHVVSALAKSMMLLIFFEKFNRDAPEHIITEDTEQLKYSFKRYAQNEEGFHPSLEARVENLLTECNLDNIFDVNVKPNLPKIASIFHQDDYTTISSNEELHITNYIAYPFLPRRQAG